MRRDLTASIVAAVVFTVLFGLVYPLVTTGVAQVLFPDKADGSRVERDGEVVGSELIGQGFQRAQADPEGGARQVRQEGDQGARSRATSSRARRSPATRRNVTFFNNLGPNNKELSQLFAANLEAYLALEGALHPGLEARRRPGRRGHDLGLGRRPPHLGGQRPHPGEPRRRGARPAARAGQRADRRQHRRPRLGVLGEPGVNVLELNLALDEEAGAMTDVARTGASIFDRALLLAGARSPACASSTRASVPQPGHVRGRDRRR